MASTGTGQQHINYGSIVNDESPNPDNSPTESDSHSQLIQTEFTNEPPSRTSTSFCMFALSISVFLAALDTTIVTTAVETISADFHSSASFTWIGSSYFLAFAASSTIWGKLSDIFGRKNILLLANVAFMVGSFICALASTIGVLFAGRSVQGVGAGGLIIVGNIVIGDLSTPRRRGLFYSVMSIVWALASSIGPLLGGVFSEKLSWRWCFFINLPLATVAFLVLVLFMKVETPHITLRAGIAAVDWLGAFFIVASTLLFLFGLELGGTVFPWDSGPLVALWIASAFAAVTGAIVELKVSKSPIIPARLFRNRSVLGCYAVCCLHSLAFISGSFFLPLYFQVVRGLTPILSGVYTQAIAWSLSVSSALTGIFLKCYGLYFPPIILGLIIMTIGFGFFIELDLDTPLSGIICAEIAAGFGLGPNFQAPIVALQSFLDREDLAAGTALFGFIRMLASAISVVVGGAILQAQLDSRGIKYSADGGALAAVNAIRNEPPARRREMRESFAESLKVVWIFYTCVAATGLAAAMLIQPGRLENGRETDSGDDRAQEDEETA